MGVECEAYSLVLPRHAFSGEMERCELRSRVLDSCNKLPCHLFCQFLTLSEVKQATSLYGSAAVKDKKVWRSLAISKEHREVPEIVKYTLLFITQL